MKENVVLLMQNLLDHLYDLRENIRSTSVDQLHKLTEVIMIAEQLQPFVEEKVLRHISSWRPPLGHSITRPSLKTKEITALTPAQAGLKMRLRRTSLGKVYLKYLKPLAFFHKTVLRCWYFLYALYAFFRKKAYPLVSLSHFMAVNKTKAYLLAKKERVITPNPIVFPIKEAAYLVSPHEYYEFPEISVACISNGMIYGGTNFVFAQGCVIHHNLYDFKHDSTSEELHRRIVIHLKKQRVRWLQRDDDPIKLPLAAAFVDACAFNYAHWLTEVLSRIVLFCNDPRFKKIPIIVNSDLHPNIMESLAVVIGDEREVIQLPMGRAILVETLYITSAAGYVPFGRRPIRSKDHSHGYFSPYAFQVLRAHVQSFIPASTNIIWPNKIFLRRASSVRHLTNAASLEQLLFDRGYAIVEPEKLTFLQQVQLFSQATTVIGPTGAALANIIFSPKQAKIFILISKHPDLCYWYWQNIACTSEKTVYYILGEIDSAHEYGIHANYTIDIDNFLLNLDECL